MTDRLTGRQAPLLLLILLLALPFQVRAEQSFGDWLTDRTKTAVACGYQDKVAKGATCDQSTWYGRTIISAQGRCDEKMKSPLCRDLFRKEPILAETPRKCDPKSVCDDVLETQGIWADCAQGYGFGTIEMGEQIIDAVSKARDAYVADIVDRLMERKEYYDQLRKCTTTACKRKIIEKAQVLHGDENGVLAGLPQFTDEELSKYPAIWIDERVKMAIGQQKQIDRQSKRWKSLYEQAVEAEARQLTGAARARAEAQASILTTVLKHFEKKGAELECVDRETRTQLMCWGIAQVVDPTIVAAAAAKGIRTASLILKRWPQPKVKAPVVAEEVITHAPRGFEKYVVPASMLVGKPIGETSFYAISPSMRIRRFRNQAGEVNNVFEQVVKLPDGKFQIDQRELVTDSMTGFIDMNFETGRTAMEMAVKAKQGKVTVVVIDLNDLGVVSTQYTHGFTGTPKEMKANSFKIGDQYLKDAAKALAKVVEGKGLPARLAGDEFIVLLDEVDPAKAQKIMNDIAAAIREARDVFVKEGRHREQVYADSFGPKLEVSPEAEANYRLKFLPFSQPNASIGGVVVNGEAFGDAIEIGDKLQAANKFDRKTNVNAPTVKYGGVPQNPDGFPNLGYVARVQPPAIGRGMRTEVFPSLSEVQTVMQETRNRVVFRVADRTVVEYTTLAGNRILREEIYHTDATGRRAILHAPEVFTNARTKIIDVRHERGKGLFSAFTLSARTKDRAMFWVNLENLGIINYFANGAKDGDRALAAVSKAIQDVMPPASIPGKRPGSEFVVASEQVRADQIAGWQKKLEERIANDPVLKEMFDQQEKILRGNIRDPQKTPVEKKDAQAALEKLLTARQKLVTVHSTSVNGAEDLEAVIARMRVLRYPE